MNAFDGHISRVDTVEERMNELEHKSIEITQTKREKEKKERKKKPECLRALGKYENTKNEAEDIQPQIQETQKQGNFRLTHLGLPARSPRCITFKL